MSDDNSLILSLWTAAEEAITYTEAVDSETARVFAKPAVVAVLRRLAEEIQKAEEDDVLWPDSGDLLILAGELEESDV